MAIIGGILSAPTAVGGLGEGSSETHLVGTKLSPGGVESVFEYNGLYLNIRHWIDTYIIDSVTMSAEIRSQSLPNPGFDGETPLKTLYGARTITLSGYIRAHTLWKMRDMEQALRRAFNNVNVEYPMNIRSGSAAQDTIIFCKKSADIDIPDAQQNFEFKRKFQISLRASDPRIYSWTRELVQKSLSTEPTFTIENNGTYDTLPEIQITGPITNLVLTRTQESDVQTMRVKSGVTIPAGETWNFDSMKHTVRRMSDNSNKYDSRDSSLSTWIDFPAGSSRIDVTGTGMTGATLASIFYRHARV